MEQLKIFDERLLEAGFFDNIKNRWWVKNSIVWLKLNVENTPRKIGIVYDDRFIVYRTRSKHLFQKSNSYGFSSNIIDGLYQHAGVKWVDVYDDFGMYRVDIQVIKTSGYLHFKQDGLELQHFLPIQVLEQYRIELPEDTNRRNLLGNSWFNELRAEFHKPYWTHLGLEIAKRRQTATVYPNREDVFKAFKLTEFDKIKVVIIGQDPYHNGVADGLAFSSKDPLRTPPSLKMIYQSIEKDIKFGLYLDQKSDLSYWAKQGVLLLNTCLTVEAGQPNSHRQVGWGFLIERVLEVLHHHAKDLVFMLWGSHAKSLRPRVDNVRHLILEAEHPANAARDKREWYHNECFKKCNQFLESKGYGEIDW